MIWKIKGTYSVQISRQPILLTGSQIHFLFSLSGETVRYHLYHLKQKFVYGNFTEFILVLESRSHLRCGYPRQTLRSVPSRSVPGFCLLFLCPFQVEFQSRPQGEAAWGGHLERSSAEGHKLSLGCTRMHILSSSIRTLALRLPSLPLLGYWIRFLLSAQRLQLSLEE